MLYLSRKIGESVRINEDIRITVIEIQGKSIKLGFEYKEGTMVLRQELYEKIQNENQAAAVAAAQFAVHLEEV